MYECQDTEAVATWLSFFAALGFAAGRKSPVTTELVSTLLMVLLYRNYTDTRNNSDYPITVQIATSRGSNGANVMTVAFEGADSRPMDLSGFSLP